MEPVFAATKRADVKDETAASAAVLAGHFMVWAGPPTTMYQRKFVPDWATGMLIQLLGLMEDVAVVLATWAGTNPQTQCDAEIGLYIFMIAMNAIRFCGLSKERDIREEHLSMLFLTLLATATKLFLKFDTEFVASMMKEVTTTILMPPLCATAHSNIKLMVYTFGKVSLIALVFRICSKQLSCLRRRSTV